ncbi:hypothetical protein JUJ52_03445 [Virgibacillus sp. AGTR]|uniref:hypothetical protein n=1 Tax=Virgibacillus sp. AGTR TaxID=2812055 RepID=UPI001D16844B|nr:hypothetical protein [Virgibacillus sp. AGTR]MCC2249012.1 hypothetical protein [Virgibacillus sp. AGTR]
MSDFEFDLDIEAELAGIRGYKEKTDKSKEAEPSKPAQKAYSENSKHSGGSSSNKPKPSGSVSEQEESLLSHYHGEEDASSPVTTAVAESGTVSSIDWKRFKTMPGIFEHVGGERPVGLSKNIKKTQVAGIPEPLLWAVQKRLKEKHIGAVVSFPWGEYKITENNRVFTTKSSLFRYLLYDSLRDVEGTHVQFAKQWVALHHPVFDKGFDPETHLGPANDELDIYVLLFVAYTSEEYASGKSSESERDYQTAERIGMLNMNMGRVLDKLNEQEQMFRAHAERNAIMQTVILLDRMGLLNGGLPRDVREFVRVLEENRGALAETDVIITDYIHAEKKRQKTLARQERMRQMQQRKG